MAALLGKPLMPWQQYVADVVLEVDPESGELAYPEWGLTVPRQSGKSTLLLAKACHRASAPTFFGSRQHIVYTAQTRKDARKKFEEEYAAILAESAHFRSRATPHWGNGNEHIRFANQSRFSIEANTEKSGHGSTLHEAYIDEAFAQVDGRLEQAFSPAMLIPRNTQLGWISTAGWLDGSPYLEAKVARGREAARAGQRTGLAYFEWSAEDGTDPSDEDAWWSYMPALGHTITPGKIRQRLEAAIAENKLNDFRRAYMNLWVPKTSFEEPVIPEDAWRTHFDPDSTIVDRMVVAVYVSPLSRDAAVAVAGANGRGQPQVEITAEHIDGEVIPDYRRGTDWLVPRVAKLCANYGIGVVYAYGQGAESVKAELERAGLAVDVFNSPRMAAACGQFYDLSVVQPEFGLVHTGQPELDRSLQLARRTETEHGWQWSRRKSEGDIAPLVAATVALSAHLTAPQAQTFVSFR